MNKKRRLTTISLLLIMVFFTSGCSFLTPEDDLNGNNKRREEYIKKLDVEKEREAAAKNEAAQKANQQAKQPPSTEQAMSPESTVAPMDAGTEIDSEKKEKNLEYAKKYSKATLVTNYGEIKIEFFGEDAPQAVGNFFRLAEEGFYTNTKFHRVIEGFMIQAGDPNSKDDDWADDGKGGPGYKFADEINEHKLVRGSFAMANSGANTNGSQFFIVTSAETPHLDGKHTNFGKVFEGMDTVDKIEKVRIDENSHPTQDVIIEEIRLR